MFLSVGATKGKLLFDGVLRVMRYFFDALGAEFSAGLLIRGVEKKGQITQHPYALHNAQELGSALVNDREILELEGVCLPGRQK